jgi:hypothetical protein
MALLSKQKLERWFGFLYRFDYRTKTHIRVSKPSKSRSFLKAMMLCW